MKQRQLTQEELNLAPEWATHYAVMVVSGRVVYLDLDNCKMTMVSMIDKGYGPINYGGFFRKGEIQPIPRKAFDISTMEFNDDRIIDVDLFSDGTVEINMDSGLSCELSKNELVLIAKALGVTAEDFK